MFNFQRQNRNKIHQLDEYLSLEQILVDFKRKIKPFVLERLRVGFVKVFEYSLKVGELDHKILKMDSLFYRFNSRFFFNKLKISFMDMVIVWLYS